MTHAERSIAVGDFNGGELCYNPDQSSGITTCDCGPPKGVSSGV